MLKVGKTVVSFGKEENDMRSFVKVFCPKKEESLSSYGDFNKEIKRMVSLINYDSPYNEEERSYGDYVLCAFKKKIQEQAVV